MKQWYESLFENYGQKYDNERYTQGTPGECDFIEREIDYNKSLKILDVGCGTGRHSIELSERGYRVTGIDLSDSQLMRAREMAKARNLTIDFRKHDARDMDDVGGSRRTVGDAGRNRHRDFFGDRIRIYAYVPAPGRSQGPCPHALSKLP